MKRGDLLHTNDVRIEGHVMNSQYPNSTDARAGSWMVHAKGELCMYLRQRGDVTAVLIGGSRPSLCQCVLAPYRKGLLRDSTGDQ